MSGRGVRLGVAGWPVAHSLSPAMQNAALRAAGLVQWRYQLLPIPPALFGEVVRALPRAGFRGVNVTLPHKQAALAIADEASAAALAIGAANALIFEAGGSIRAENTDAQALLDELPVPAAGKTALVLGAGGSARAAVWALLQAGAAEVLVWNRTAERARALCAEIGGTAVSHAPLADLLVNCTASGLDRSADAFKELPLSADEVRNYGCLVDFVYASEEQTQMTRAATAGRLPVLEGLSLLIAQGALSFELFTGRRPDLSTMRSAVRPC